MRTKSQLQRQMMRVLKDMPKQVTKHLTVSDLAKSFNGRIGHE